jgi:hypothetical protein
MRTGIKEVAKMAARLREYIRIGNANAIETQRLGLVRERGFQIGIG